MTAQDSSRWDALLPDEMAHKAEQAGVSKANRDLLSTLTLAVLAGAFIALGSVFATTVSAGEMPFGVSRLLGGLTFSLGLILVVVAGAELFTGNNLIIMATVSGKVSLSSLLRNWTIVYLGNFLGAFLTAIMVFLSQQHQLGQGVVGAKAVQIAASKCELGFVQAIALGVLCNTLVCLAVWLCFSARTTTDKILSIIFPITGFVAAGFEHCVANMYMIPLGLFIDGSGDGTHPALTWQNFFLKNLVPVTLGNLLGGVVLVGCVYWFVYLRPRRGVSG